jgi:hypothetical protein
MSGEDDTWNSLHTFLPGPIYQRVLLHICARDWIANSGYVVCILFTYNLITYVRVTCFYTLKTRYYMQSWSPSLTRHKLLKTNAK